MRRRYYTVAPRNYSSELLDLWVRFGRKLARVLFPVCRGGDDFTRGSLLDRAPLMAQLPLRGYARSGDNPGSHESRRIGAGGSELNTFNGFQGPGTGG